MNLCSALPISNLPPTGCPPGQEVFWLFDDSPENFRQKGGHPIYGEKDIVYRFNSLGYRCPEFDASAEIQIVAAGCSYVLGHALPQNAVFHELFAERLRAETGKTVLVWNLGRCGAGNDYISRLLYLALAKLNPQLVLVNFTHACRREYVSLQNRYINYTPTSKPYDEISKDIFHHFGALSSPFDDQLNFFKNYKAVECLLANRTWLYSHIAPKEFEPLAAHMDLSRYAGQLEVIDRARDKGHPGPESHRRLAELYWKKFIELGGLAKFADKAKI